MMTMRMIQKTKDSRAGFTIIEVMLFLGISGALFAALMIGIGTNITQQRYSDSVRSFAALIQNEYSQALNATNQDISSKECNQTTSGIVNDGKRDTWGGSTCVILGRAIILTNGGNDVQTASVTALENTSGTDIQEMTDATAFAQYYKPMLASNFDGQTTAIDWQSYITTTDAPRKPSQAIILLLKSPVTGALRVFITALPTSLSNGTDLTSIVGTAANATTPLTVCVENTNSGLLPKRAVTINPTIASTDGVTMDTGVNGACQ